MALLNIGTGEALDPEIDNTLWKEKFKVNFIVFKNYCKVEGLQAPNSIDTLNTWDICDFL